LRILKAHFIGSKVSELLNKKKKTKEEEDKIQSSSSSETLSEEKEKTLRRLKCYVHGIGKIETEDQLFYPGTKVRRECVRYSRFQKNIYYTPPDYSRPNLTSADPDELNATNILFNQVDDGIDRRSVRGRYKVVDFKPMNPAGRTGITGRGDLRRWGPNHIVCIDLRREIANETAVYKLQLQVEKKLSDGTIQMTIPCSYVDSPDSDMPVKALKPIIQELVRVNGRHRAREILDFMYDRKSLKRRYYQPSLVNTDNAWIERTIWKVNEYWNNDLSSLDMRRLPTVAWKIIKMKPL
ncbi:hypothetical protein D918_04627, partial [Trichuris suis]